MEKETRKCPYCGEEILIVAKKCKHCGEWLDNQEEEQEEQHKTQRACPTCCEMIDEECDVCPNCNEQTHFRDNPQPLEAQVGSTPTKAKNGQSVSSLFFIGLAVVCFVYGVLFSIAYGKLTNSSNPLPDEEAPDTVAIADEDEQENTPGIMFQDNSQTSDNVVSSGHSDDDEVDTNILAKDLCLIGYVDGKHRFHMFLEYNSDYDFSGYYYYDSQGSDKKITLSCGAMDNKVEAYSEVYGDRFLGELSSGSFRGVFVRGSDAKRFEFHANIVEPNDFY